MPTIVVLVRTHSPGNLGSAARAVRNFGASLLLLDPKADRHHPDARAFASGAEEDLDSAEVLTDWADIGPRVDVLVALTSVRGRAARGLPPALTWPTLRSQLMRGRTCALIFGPERSGLSKDELQECDARLSLPAADAFPTLNLAQAVAASLALSRPSPGRAKNVGPADPPAGARDVRRLLETWRSMLDSSGYPGKGRSKEVLAEMDAVFRRARPSQREVSLLLGALAALRGDRPER
jgi:TrmH family RNA methyltransferase